ncbi:CLUMA_CG015354, isoform A [Clunio marinus]|uniref:CLUMA_CG015354, isoform A n=1 Tax=Clunio marinus TaxID=568069 RepID=A0A1J1IQ73_9DIPT|nr:CLUMA_CG015354, isoform A [Clunio marinus]
MFSYDKISLQKVISNLNAYTGKTDLITTKKTIASYIQIEIILLCSTCTFAQKFIAGVETPSRSGRVAKTAIDVCTDTKVGNTYCNDDDICVATGFIQCTGAGAGIEFPCGGEFVGCEETYNAAAPPVKNGDAKCATTRPSACGDPVADFQCLDAGIFPDPLNCQKYFFCYEDGGDLTAVEYTCEKYYVFDPSGINNEYCRLTIGRHCITADCNNESKNVLLEYPYWSDGQIVAMCRGSSPPLVTRCAEGFVANLNTLPIECEFVCKTPGNFPYPGDDTKYNYCFAVSGGLEHKVNSCFPNYYFNPGTNVCEEKTEETTEAAIVIMKTILLLLAVFTVQSLAQSSILDCFAPVLDNVNGEREDLVEWSQDVRDTTVRLQEQRQRCNDIPRDDPPTAIQDRIIQACNAAWSASLAFELNRLFTDLVAIDPELAEELRRQSADCFPIPEAPEAIELKRKLLKTLNSFIFKILTVIAENRRVNMKTLLLLVAVVGLTHFSASQAPEIPEDINLEEVLACVQAGIDAIPDQSQAVAEWAVQTVQSVIGLVEQRRRCLEMTNDRLQQACMATWTASVLFEANRLRNDLAILPDESTAAIFEEHFLGCFGVSPDDVPA